MFYRSEGVSQYWKHTPQSDARLSDGYEFAEYPRGGIESLMVLGFLGAAFQLISASGELLALAFFFTNMVRYGID